MRGSYSYEQTPCQTARDIRGKPSNGNKGQASRSRGGEKRHPLRIDKMTQNAR